MESKMRLSFSEYIESKNILKLAVEDAPKHKQIFNVTKYCKIPVHEDFKSNTKEYIGLKPKDSVEVIWETHESQMIVRYIIINEQYNYFPTWTNKKFCNWLTMNCKIN